MIAVFVETNWVVDLCAPVHHRDPEAVALLAHAARGDLSLHLPAPCLGEARRVIRQRFHPKREAQAIMQFTRMLERANRVTPSEANSVRRVCQIFESEFSAELADLEPRLSELRTAAGVDVFPLDEGALTRAVDLSISLDLAPFDNAILAAVLSRSTRLRSESRLLFAEKDGDLRPFEKNGTRKSALADLYDQHGITVVDTFNRDRWALEPGP